MPVFSERRLPNLMLILVLSVLMAVTVPLSSAYAADAVQTSTVRATSLHGLLAKQYDKHYLGLEPTQRDSAIVLTLAYEPQNNADLRGKVNFMVLTTDGLRKFLAGADPQDVNIAAGSILQFDGAGNKMQAAFQASGMNGYTVIVYNNSALPTGYTLTVQGAVLVDDAGQTQLAVPTDGGNVTNDSAQTTQAPSTDVPVDSMQVADTNPASVAVGPLNARKLSGSLDQQFDRHFLTLQPDVRDGQMFLNFTYDPQNVQELTGKINFWVLTDDGVRRMVAGESPNAVNLATGFPAPFAGAGNVLRANLRATGIGPYTVVVYNNSTVPATYMLSVDGGLLIDQYGQTNEAKAAVAEVAAAAQTPSAAVAPAGQSPAAPETSASGMTNAVFTDTVAASVSGNVSMTMGVPALAGDLTTPYSHQYLGLVPQIRDGRVILTLKYDPQNDQKLRDNINFWVLTEDAWRQVISGARPDDVNMATGVAVRFGSERGVLQAAFDASGRGTYTVIVYNNSSIPAHYILSVQGGLLEEPIWDTTVPASLP